MQEPLSQSYPEVEQEDAKRLKWKNFVEAMKQWKEKEKEAKCKANFFFSSPFSIFSFYRYLFARRCWTKFLILIPSLKEQY